jgi:copper chaperone CopZ
MTKRHDLAVPDVSCEHCVKAITGSVGPLPGVESVSVDLANKMVSVVGGDREKIVAAIEDAGYDVG